MTIIEVTHADRNTPVWINFAYVVRMGMSNYNGGTTLIDFFNDEQVEGGNYIFVKESPKEILNRLASAEVCK